jgi:hypothetical protein
MLEGPICFLSSFVLLYLVDRQETHVLRPNAGKGSIHRHRRGGNEIVKGPPVLVVNHIVGLNGCPSVWPTWLPLEHQMT